LLHRFRRPAPAGSCSRPRHRELAAAILTIAAGGALLAPAITRRMIHGLRAPAHGQEQAGSPAGLDTLTPRELEVLTRIAHGRSNAEIGAALFLSEPTIKTHVTRILAKLQLRDRVQAVVVAYESGLIQPGIH
jgi:DNA-binding NarL/FixJ family response regulator